MYFYFLQLYLLLYPYNAYIFYKFYPHIFIFHKFLFIFVNNTCFYHFFEHFSTKVEATTHQSHKITDYENEIEKMANRSSSSAPPPNDLNSTQRERNKQQRNGNLHQHQRAHHKRREDSHKAAHRRRIKAVHTRHIASREERQHCQRHDEQSQAKM